MLENEAAAGRDNARLWKIHMGNTVALFYSCIFLKAAMASATN